MLCPNCSDSWTPKKNGVATDDRHPVEQVSKSDLPGNGGQNPVEVPDTLKQRDQWVLWKNENGSKVPYQVDGVRKASSTDPQTWATFEVAEAAYDPEKHAGLGFVFSPEDSLCGIDLDKCRNSKTWVIDDLALVVIEQLASYAEVSPSGTGVKIWIKGAIPDGKGFQRKLDDQGRAIEVYDRDRYFAFTGEILQGVPEDVRPAQEALDYLIETYRKKPKQPAPQPVIVLPNDSQDACDRAMAYVHATPVQQCGASNCHNAAFFLANKLARGFSLEFNLAARILFSWMQGNPKHGWQFKDAEHKIKQALEDGTEPIGEMLSEGNAGSEVDISGLLDRPPAETCITRAPPADDEPENVPPPVSLNTTRVPTMSSNIFNGCGWLGDMVEAVALATETPRELAALMGLGVLATSCQKRFSVRPEPGYFEPLNLWIVCALPSGHRKTAVVVQMNQPLYDWEAKYAALIQAEIDRATSEHATAEARIKALRQKAAREKDQTKYAEIKQEIEELEAGLPKIPSRPVLYTDDVTPEHLGTMLAEQNERMAILSDEGGIFDLMAGRYSNGIPNLDVWLKSHSGSPIRVDRGCRPPVDCRHPALTIVISPQPDVLRGLASKEGFRGRGLLARFLYGLPISRLGYRTLEPKPVPKDVSEAYSAAIIAILDTAPTVTEEGMEHPHVLRLGETAWQLWKSKQKEVEVNMRPGGRFDHITDWAGKFPGAIARIAGNLHVAKHAHRRPEAAEIARDTMACAIALGNLLAEHALLAFDLVGSDPAWDGARRVWKWIEREKEPQFCKRDCWHPLRGTFKRVLDIEPSLEVLVETGHIMPLDSPRKGHGPKGKWFRVNPFAVEAWASGSNYYPEIDDQNDQIDQFERGTDDTDEEPGHFGHGSEDTEDNDEWEEVV